MSLLMPQKEFRFVTKECHHYSDTLLAAFPRDWTGLRTGELRSGSVTSLVHGG